MGTVFGAATMASCVGMAARPLVGGWIFDRFGDYAGMHLASLAVGLAAVASDLLAKLATPSDASAALVSGFWRADDLMRRRFAPRRGQA